MADSNISSYSALAGTGVDTAADVLEIVDTSGTVNRKIVVSNLQGAGLAAAGSIHQASAAGVAAALAIGTARQVLTVNAGATLLAYQAPIALSAEQATTSGTSFDFTGIPAGVKRIKMMFKNVSTSGTSALLIQLGDSGGIEATGYVGSNSYITSVVSSSILSTGFRLGDITADMQVNGSVTLSLESGFVWAASGIISDQIAGKSLITSGAKGLTAVLDRVRLTTVNGTDTFDLGGVAISYE